MCQKRDGGLVQCAAPTSRPHLRPHAAVLEAAGAGSASLQDFPNAGPPGAPSRTQEDSDHVVQQAAAARRQLFRAVRPACGAHDRGRARLHVDDPELQRRGVAREVRVGSGRGRARRRQGDGRSAPPAAPHLHHADRRRADPQPDQLDGRHRRPAAGHQRGAVAVQRHARQRGRAAPVRDLGALLRPRPARRQPAGPPAARPRSPRPRSRPASRSATSSPTPTA